MAPAFPGRGAVAWMQAASGFNLEHPPCEVGFFRFLVDFPISCGTSVDPSTSVVVESRTDVRE